MNRVDKNLLIIKAVEDFYNEKGHDMVAKYLMGHRCILTEEELKDCFKISKNLKDGTYIKSIGSPEPFAK